MTPRRAVAVVGPGSTEDATVLADAATVGAGLAAAGYVVVTGGLGGVMRAAAAGAHEANGLVVGILPGTVAAEADDGVDIAIPTGSGEGRNVLVVRSAAAVVAVGGSWGTLAEIALARRMGKPVVSLHGWRIDGPAADDDLVVVASADEAVREVAARLSSTPS